MKFGKGVVKFRIPILILACVLLVPAIYFTLNTRVNYDMLTYLPSDMETVIGQEELKEQFGKGGFTFIIIEGMSDSEVSELKAKIENVDHVDTVLWYDSFADISMPKELLPDKIYDAFNKEDSTMMAVFFDSGTSEDVTMEALRKIRAIAGEQCFVSGMTALVVDLKDICEEEEPVYVGLAVLLALVAMELFLDSWLIPIVFLISIGIMIMLNLGTNFMLGEISYITKAMAAVLQLAVTMDYSIFLWHCFNDQKAIYEDSKEAMAVAIKKTLNSVVGSSVTTIAGFIALCFMSFTLGRDIGIVMAKGVVLGVIGSITVLPALILLMEKPLKKTHHRSLIPNMKKFSKGVVKIFPVFLVIFAMLIPPAIYGYNKTNDEVYYDMGAVLPEEMSFVAANRKLQDDYNIASTLIVLTDSHMSQADVRSMCDELEAVDGVENILGLEALLGQRVPEEFLPDDVVSTLKSENLEMMLINSSYYAGSDAENEQIDIIDSIIKSYDENGMVIGEAPCMKDMIETTGHDFAVVNIVSIGLIFLIIFFVERSISLPFILIEVIELGIFINLGITHFTGQSLPFIAPIIISTIQLGATVDYAILMTTIYKAKRSSGLDKRQSVIDAMTSGVPSIIVSGMGLFAATFGVGLYSDVDIVSSMCMLMARGAVISMVLVTFILPSMFMLFDRIICKTTLGMTHIDTKKKNEKKMKPEE